MDSVLKLSGDLIAVNELFRDFLDAAYLTIGETDFDTMGMHRGTGENILDDTLSECARSLVFFQDNPDAHAYSDRRPAGSVAVHYTECFFEDKNTKINHYFRTNEGPAR